MKDLSLTKEQEVNYSGLPVSSITDKFDHFEVRLAGFTAGMQWCTQALGLKHKAGKACHEILHVFFFFTVIYTGFYKQNKKKYRFNQISAQTRTFLK